MRTKSILVMVVLAFVTGNLQAETITIFDSNAIISAGESYDTVVVKGDGTVVEMTNGSINKLITMNSSMFNVPAGAISSISAIYSYDSSVLNIASGSIDYLTSYKDSQINISGNAISNVNAWQLYGTSILSISSPNVVVENFCLFKQNSRLNLSAGSMNTINMQHHSTARISGGSIGGIGGQEHYGHIAIIGYDLAAVPYGGPSGRGEITGYWNNDEPISIGSWGDYSAFTLYDGVIPADCVSKPENDLSGDCKVNFIDLSKIASEWLFDGTE